MRTKNNLEQIFRHNPRDRGTFLLTNVDDFPMRGKIAFLLLNEEIVELFQTCLGSFVIYRASSKEEAYKKAKADGHYPNDVWKIRGRSAGQVNEWIDRTARRVMSLASTSSEEECEVSILKQWAGNQYSIVKSEDVGVAYVIMQHQHKLYNQGEVDRPSVVIGECDTLSMANKIVSALTLAESNREEEE